MALPGSHEVPLWSHIPGVMMEASIDRASEQQYRTQKGCPRVWNHQGETGWDGSRGLDQNFRPKWPHYPLENTCAHKLLWKIYEQFSQPESPVTFMEMVAGLLVASACPSPWVPGCVHTSPEGIRLVLLPALCTSLSTSLLPFLLPPWNNIGCCGRRIRCNLTFSWEWTHWGWKIGH